jgi:hypothetical protein
MTTIDLIQKRGDSRHLLFAVTDTDVPANPVDISGGIAKFSVKFSGDDPDSAAVILKKSYRPIEVEFTDPVNGKLVIKIHKADTADEQPECLVWDLEVTRQGEALPAASVGTLTVTPGSGAIVGVGTAFSSLRIGDVIVPAGAFPANLKPVTVLKVVSATSIETDYTEWAAEAGIPFLAFVGDVKTPGGGKFTLVEDVTR